LPRALVCSVCSGPSVTGKERLIQKLVEEFPQVFKAVPRHSTPAYGQDAPDGQSAEANADVTVSTEAFKVGDVHATKQSCIWN